MIEVGLRKRCINSIAPLRKVSQLVACIDAWVESFIYSYGKNNSSKWPSKFASLVPLYMVLAGTDASAIQTSEVRYHKFPSPPYIASQKAFWESIFDRYPRSSEVIHDAMYPSVVIDVIDFDLFAKKYRRGASYSKRERSRLISRYVNRYQLAIDRIRKHRDKALRYGAMEKRVYHVYQRNRDALKALYKGEAGLRTQVGLKDEFKIATQRAEKYLPHMERIFRKYRLPVDLTRMAFVESMFNVNAVSKVGASGIWQFMPETGRLYMTVNQWIDERNSPLKATRAAAKLLRSNYALLGTWPLAITAYNHGAGGLQKAIKIHDTKKFDVIAQNYRSSRFGFASRNFYAEFLAARSVYNRQYARYLTPKAALPVVPVRMSSPTTLRQLLSRTALSRKSLEDYNLCLTDKAYDRYLDRHLPPNFELFVPRTVASEIQNFTSKHVLTGQKKGRI